MTGELHPYFQVPVLGNVTFGPDVTSSADYSGTAHQDLISSWIKSFIVLRLNKIEVFKVLVTLEAICGAKGSITGPYPAKCSARFLSRWAAAACKTVLLCKNSWHQLSRCLAGNYSCHPPTEGKQQKEE